MAAAMVLMAGPTNAMAQPSGEPLKNDSAGTGSGKETGILTSRLSGRQLRIWRSIERIVFARDKSGRLLHPTLHGLWQEAEGSGCAIYIEMPDPKGGSPYFAGGFFLEKPGSANEPPAGVIRLYLPAIGNASTSGRTRRDNGFMPFEGLRRMDQRYAEVLGHELVHALLTLTDPRHASVCREVEREVAALTLQLKERKEKTLDDETRARMQRIQEMSEELERRPEAVEVDIWRELLGNQKWPEKRRTPFWTQILTESR